MKKAIFKSESCVKSCAVNDRMVHSNTIRKLSHFESARYLIPERYAKAHILARLDALR